MDRERARVVGLALGAIGALVGALFLMEWWEVHLGAEMATVNLTRVQSCHLDVCVSVSHSRVGGGFFVNICRVAFFGGIVLAAVVGYTAGCRLVAGFANERVTSWGYRLAVVVFVCVLPGMYLFGPDPGSAQVDAGIMGALTFTVVRTWAPVLMLVGCVLAIGALYSSQHQADLAGLPPARIVSEVREVVAAPAERAISTQIPPLLKGQLQFVVLSGEVTRGGIDARREDGSTVLVMWRDVVGVVARRLPPTFEGVTFVDIVSSAGSTLRVLPWSRLTGEPIAAGDDATRARAVVKLVSSFCPEARLDPATRSFLEGSVAAQLPTVDNLAAHDTRLA